MLDQETILAMSKISSNASTPILTLSVSVICSEAIVTQVLDELGLQLTDDLAGKRRIFWVTQTDNCNSFKHAPYLISAGFLLVISFLPVFIKAHDISWITCTSYIFLSPFDL